MPIESHPPLPLEMQPLRTALESALAQAGSTPAQATPPFMAQWLQTLHHALPHPALWAQSTALLAILLDHLHATGRVGDMIEWLHVGIAQSRRYNDPHTTAIWQIQLGREYIVQGDPITAKMLLREGIAYFETTAFPYPPALNSLAYLALSQAHWDDAEQWAQQALALLPPDQWKERGNSYRVLGGVAHGRAAYEDALAYHEEGLRWWRLGDTPRYVAFGLVNLGSALRALKRYAEAQTHYGQAIVIFEAVGDPINRSYAQMNLGNVFLENEQWESAIEHYYAAEQVMAHSKHRLPLAVLYNNWGMAYAGAMQWKRAVRAYEQSIALWSELDNLQARANDRDNLGVALTALRRYDEAIITFHAALEDIEGKDNPATVALREEIHHHLAQAEQHQAMQ